MPAKMTLPTEFATVGKLCLRHNLIPTLRLRLKKIELAAWFKSGSSEVTEVTPPSNTATFARVAVLLLLTTTYLERAYNDARVTPPPRHVRIGPWRRITSNCHPRMNQCRVCQFANVLDWMPPW